MTSILETNLTIQGNRMNVITKQVTSWAAIIAVPTFVTGFYGMNVPYPGFTRQAGFAASVAMMILAGIVLYIIFPAPGLAVSFGGQFAARWRELPVPASAPLVRPQPGQADERMVVTMASLPDVIGPTGPTRPAQPARPPSVSEATRPRPAPPTHHSRRLNFPDRPAGRFRADPDGGPPIRAK